MISPPPSPPCLESQGFQFSSHFSISPLSFFLPPLKGGRGFLMSPPPNPPSGISGLSVLIPLCCISSFCFSAYGPVALSV